MCIKSLSQVSKDGMTWTTLYTHVDDCSLNEPGSTHTWTIQPPSEEKVLMDWLFCNVVIIQSCRNLMQMIYGKFMYMGVMNIKIILCKYWQVAVAGFGNSAKKRKDHWCGIMKACFTYHLMILSFSMMRHIWSSEHWSILMSLDKDVILPRLFKVLMDDACDK